MRIAICLEYIFYIPTAFILLLYNIAEYSVENRDMVG